MSEHRLIKTLFSTSANACFLIFLAACADVKPEVGSESSPQSTGVVADRFEIRHSLSGETLTLSVDTDLPDETEVMVSVARGYRETGDTTAYSHAYFEESGTVGQWRVPRQVVLDEHTWHSGLDEKQRLLARGGDPFAVGEIDDSIAVSFVVPVNQDSPRFGSRNEHLTGRAVTMGSLGWPIIERDVWLVRPLDGSGTIASGWASASDLQIGQRYRTTGEIPLMPEFEPADPMAALARIQQIPSGGAIVILQQRDRRGTPWYRVTAYSSAGGHIGEGWINSTALLGQDIQIVR